ncbi:signal peptidase I [Dysgonomonas reticulitermitis]
MSSKKKNIYLFLGKVILITLLIIFCIRTFFIEPYTVSSAQMETALVSGERILIDKTAYGIRMPITILTVPFTFDKYSGVIELPYKRIFESSVKRNDIVLFNNPLDTLKPLDKRELLLSRCVALPGDSIHVKDGIFRINERDYVCSPDVTSEYFIKTPDRKNLTEIIKEPEISISSPRVQADTVFLCLNKLDAFILNKSLPDSMQIATLIDTVSNYKFLIPAKGKIINLNTETIAIYKQIILMEKGSKAKIMDNKLYISGEEQKHYTFTDNYYWMLSDNTLNSSDSRSLGFIPFKNIIGKAHFIWYSPAKGRSFSTIK